MFFIEQTPELLDRYGYIRGFMTRNGQPDHQRAGRKILNDYVDVVFQDPAYKFLTFYTGKVIVLLSSSNNT